MGRFSPGPLPQSTAGPAPARRASRARRPSPARRPRCSRGSTAAPPHGPAGSASSSTACVVLDDGQRPAAVVGAPREAGQRRRLLQPHAAAGDQLVPHDLAAGRPTRRRPGTRPPRRGTAEPVGDPGHLPLLGAPAVAVGPEGGALGRGLRPLAGEPRPELLEGDQLAGLDVGVPGGEGDVAGGRRGRAPVGDERAPEIAAVVGVLHVHVDLDVGPRHGDPSTPRLPVGRRRTDTGPGQLDLAGRVRRPGRAHRRASAHRSSRGRPPCASRAPPGPRPASGRFAMTSASGVDAGRPAAFGRRPSTSTLPRTSSAVRQSSAARSWRSSIPCALYRPRRPTPTPAIRLRSATSSSRSPHHSRQRHMSHWSHTIGSANSGADLVVEVLLGRLRRSRAGGRTRGRSGPWR